MSLMTLCKHPGCMRPIPYGEKFCDEHKNNQPKEKRKSAYARGYTKRWQRASAAFLRQHPLCAECERQGKATIATEVDHIIPHRGDQKLFWDSANWQPLCHECHSRKTATEDGGFAMRKAWRGRGG